MHMMSTQGTERVGWGATAKRRAPVAWVAPSEGLVPAELATSHSPIHIICLSCSYGIFFVHVSMHATEESLQLRQGNNFCSGVWGPTNGLQKKPKPGQNGVSAGGSYGKYLHLTYFESSLAHPCLGGVGHPHRIFASIWCTKSDLCRFGLTHTTS